MARPGRLLRRDARAFHREGRRPLSAAFPESFRLPLQARRAIPADALDNVRGRAACASRDTCRRAFHDTSATDALANHLAFAESALPRLRQFEIRADAR